MADSDNSRTLPEITRRKLLAGTTTSMAAAVATQTFAHAGFDDLMNVEEDPALSGWREWKLAHDRYVEANLELLDTENELYRTTPWPAIKLKRAALQTGQFLIGSRQDLDHYITAGWIGADARPGIEAQLASLRSEWDRAAERTGYRRAEHAEKLAWSRRHKLAASLANTPALSLAGAIAKLHSILEMKMPVNRRYPKLRPADPEFRKSFVPTELDLLLADLERLGRLNHG